MVCFELILKAPLIQRRGCKRSSSPGPCVDEVLVPAIRSRLRSANQRIKRLKRHLTRLLRTPHSIRKLRLSPASALASQQHPLQLGCSSSLRFSFGSEPSTSSCSRDLSGSRIGRFPLRLDQSARFARFRTQRRSRIGDIMFRRAQKDSRT